MRIEIKITPSSALRVGLGAMVVSALLVWLGASQIDNPEQMWLFYGQIWLFVMLAGLLLGGAVGLMVRFNIWRESADNSKGNSRKHHRLAGKHVYWAFGFAMYIGWACMHYFKSAPLVDVAAFVGELLAYGVGWAVGFYLVVRLAMAFDKDRRTKVP